jgi:hypothetical protein
MAESYVLKSWMFSLEIEDITVLETNEWSDKIKSAFPLNHKFAKTIP